MCGIRYGIEKRIYLFVLVFLFVTILSAFSNDVIIGVIDLSADSFYIKDNRLSGSIGSLYQCSLDNSGLSYSYRTLPLPRLITELETGEIDVAIPLGKTSARDDIAEFAAAVYEVPYLILTMDKSLKAGENLEGVTVSTQRGSNFVDIAQDLGAVVHEYSSYSQIIKMVLLNRVYAFLGPETVLGDFSQEELSKATIIPLGEFKVGFYVSKKTEIPGVISALRFGASCIGK